jgi:hypothetical protein
MRARGWSHDARPCPRAVCDLGHGAGKTLARRSTQSFRTGSNRGQVPMRGFANGVQPAFFQQVGEHKLCNRLDAQCPAVIAEYPQSGARLTWDKDPAGFESDELPVHHLLAGGQIVQLRGEAGSMFGDPRVVDHPAPSPDRGRPNAQFFRCSQGCPVSTLLVSPSFKRARRRPKHKVKDLPPTAAPRRDCQKAQTTILVRRSPAVRHRFGTSLPMMCQTNARPMSGCCDLPHTRTTAEVLLPPMLFGFLGRSGGHCLERRRRN